MGWLTKNLGYGIFGTIDTETIGTLPPGVTSTNDFLKAYDYDSNGNLLYEGWAVPGSTKSTAVWKIKKYTRITLVGTIVITDEQWAGGSNSQTNIWNNRASLSYS